LSASARQREARLAYEFVAQIDDLPVGCGLRVEIAGIEIGLFKVGDAVFAMENRCPHADFPLSKGCLNGRVVTCKAHGWEFDVGTGFRPGDSDGFPIPCFPVRIAGNRVLVDVTSPSNLRARR